VASLGLRTIDEARLFDKEQMETTNIFQMLVCEYCPVKTNVYNQSPDGANKSCGIFCSPSEDFKTHPENIAWKKNIIVLVICQQYVCLW